MDKENEEGKEERVRHSVLRTFPYCQFISQIGNSTGLYFALYTELFESFSLKVELMIILEWSRFSG